jgi:phosphohistidine phosphatase
MDLFLVRHAHAAEGALYGDDSDRPLTADGRQSALKVGASLKRQGVQLEHVVSSPLVRAVQTAELVAVSLGYDSELQILSQLQPEASTDQMLEHAVRPYAARHSVALVGHLPSMGRLLSALLGRPGLSMSKMAVVRLSYSPNSPPAKLVWVITPQRLDPVASLDGL